VRNRLSRLARCAVAVGAASLGLTAMDSSQGVTSAVAAVSRTCTSNPQCEFFVATVGVTDPQEPSGMAPPISSAIAGYQQTYVTDFPGTTLPTGWTTFNGAPGGDPGTQWAPSQVTVGNGMLQLTANYSSSQHEWLTGGTCQCQSTQTYGAYFVRSRMTGPGPTVVELLWPPDGYSWPPEVDFNETYGGTSASMATVHFDSSNQVDHRTVNIDMTQWHTWGVIWTPTSLTYVVDGHVWGVVPVASEVPHEPMALHIQQQTWCSQGFACPSSTQSTLVDWATVYTPYTPAIIRPVHSSHRATRIGIDATLSTSRLSAAVESAAATISAHHAHTVQLKALIAARQLLPVSPATRVQQIEWMLDQDIRIMGTATPDIYVHWATVSATAKAALQISLTVSS